MLVGSPKQQQQWELHGRCGMVAANVSTAHGVDHIAVTVSMAADWRLQGDSHQVETFSQSHAICVKVQRHMLCHHRCASRMRMHWMVSRSPKAVQKQQSRQRLPAGCVATCRDGPASTTTSSGGRVLLKGAREHFSQHDTPQPAACLVIGSATRCTLSSQDSQWITVDEWQCSLWEGCSTFQPLDFATGRLRKAVASTQVQGAVQFIAGQFLVNLFTFARPLNFQQVPDLRFILPCVAVTIKTSRPCMKD